jgi:hypothetical protein
MIMYRMLRPSSLTGMGLLLALPPALTHSQKAPSPPFISAFQVNKTELSHTGRNHYFILEPGYRLVLQGGSVRLIITVLDQTEKVDGVETRVVEERETKGGKLVEVSRNFFAINPQTRDLYYFGEDVDMYTNGKVTSHEGAWRAGVNGAKFGLMMPGFIRMKARYYQEVAPKVAMDRAEIVSRSETVKTPAGVFNGCLKVEETTSLEPGVKEYKLYASGVGLVQDGPLKLVKFGTAK